MNNNNKAMIWSFIAVFILALAILFFMFLDKPVRNDINRQSEWLDSNVVFPTQP